MSHVSDEDLDLLFRAVSFAAKARRHQLRKDNITPYVSHVFRVCLVLRHVFGIDDQKTLVTALLHDTVEDTTTDHDDIAEHFGRIVADWVGILTKDKRLPEAERESGYATQVSNAPWQVIVCKLADIYDNLLDSRSMPAEQQAKTRRTSRRYLDALAPRLPFEARAPFEIVENLLHREEAT
jgi:guanosine-3',5'-bis(diphosphate) 3'-pyrophosphohydrolase